MTDAEVKLRVQLDSKNAESGISGLKGRTDKLSKSFSNAGKTLTMGLTAPLVGLGAVAFKTASEFETSMNQIVGLVGVSRDELGEMEKDIFRVSRNTGKDIRELGDALFFITSAGLTGSDALEVLEMSAKASAAGLGETKVVADLATSAMNAYGSDVLSASRATDVLTAAVREGKLEPAELSQSMGSVLPIASAMGIGFDEVGAAMAAMSRTGTNAAEASTQLRGIMTSLLKPSIQAEQALNDMGLSSDGLKKQIREQGLLATLETLTENFEGNEVGAEAVFGNIRALSGVMDLMGSNADGTREIFESLTNTMGITDEAFKETDGSARDVAKVKAEMAIAFKELGDVLIKEVGPAISSLAKGIGRVAKWFGKLSPRTKKIILVVLGLLAALGPVLLIIGKIIAIIPTLIAIFKVIGVVIAAVASPIGLVVAAIGLLIAAVWLLINNWEKVKEFFVNLWESIKNIFMGVIEWFKTAFGWYINIYVEAFNRIKGFFTGLWDGIKGIFNGVVNWFKGAIKSYINIYVNAFDAIRRAFIGVWDFIKGAWSKGGKIFAGFTDGVVNTFKRVVNLLIRGINTAIAIPFRTLNSSLNRIRGVNILGVEPFKGLWKHNPIPTPRIPSLDVGTNYVGGDGLAMLHKGEAVVPKKYNPAMGGMQTIYLNVRIPDIEMDGRKLSRGIAPYHTEVIKVGGGGV